MNNPTITPKPNSDLRSTTRIDTPAKRGRGRPITTTSRGATVRRTKAKPPARTLCCCVPQATCNAACSRCGHLGDTDTTCPHCGQFYPLKSRPDLCWWQQLQSRCGAATEAAFTMRIIERLDSTKEE